MNKKTIWLESEIKFLVKNYKTHTNNEISNLINKTKKSVIKKLKELNLYRTNEEKKFLLSKINKKNGRDLNLKTIKKIASQFNSKHEFYLNDPSAYNAALKYGWIDDVTSHMVVKKVSIPQLMLKDILEYIFDEKSSFNDRKEIYPLEIDCFFKKYKIGWEYDGRYFHTDENDELKNKICEEKGIYLFHINEKNSNFRDYEKNIKEQLISQLIQINSLTNKEITPEKIINYKPIVNFPNLLTIDEKKIVYNKKLSYIKKIDEYLFKRIKKYKLYENDDLKIINDTKKHNRFKSIDEYLKYLKEKKYKSFNDMCKFEHPYRLTKRWGISIKTVKEIYE